MVLTNQLSYLIKRQNHEEDFFQIMCASQKVQTLIQKMPLGNVTKLVFGQSIIKNVKFCKISQLSRFECVSVSLNSERIFFSQNPNLRTCPVPAEVGMRASRGC